MEHFIKLVNGKVVDSENRRILKKNIYIQNGVFADTADEEKIKTVIDAKGKFILPGLIDEHVHVNFRNSNIGANADLLCLPMGVTSAVDPGSTGWSNFEGLYYHNILNYITSVYAYLHVTANGVFALSGYPEAADPAYFNEMEILKKAVRYPDIIKGLKIRLNRMTVGDRGIKPLQKAIEIAELLEKETGRHYPLEVHFDNLPETVRIADILEMLRPADILLHVFQMTGETIFTEDGYVKEKVKAAQKRGVWMDDAHGRMLWSFENLRRALSDGFLPDIISSDVVHACEYQPPASGLLHAMNVDLAAGMEEMDIFRAVTYTPAKAAGILDRAGTLDSGKPADVCIMDIASCDNVYYDWWGGSCHAEKVFVPQMTIKNGEIVYRQTFF